MTDNKLIDNLNNDNIPVFFKILIILPNCPIETEKDFFSFLNFFDLDKSIIK